MTGAVAGEVETSFWLVGFSTFIFLNLAIVKRVTELTELKMAGAQETTGRAYRVSDYRRLCGVAATGAASVLVLALYLNNDAVTKLYASPWFYGRLFCWLFTGFFALAYSLFAVRLMTRSLSHKDRVTYIIGALVLGLLALAS